MGDSAHSMRLQQLAQRLSDPRVVIDDKDNMVIHRHGAVFTSTGNVKMNVAPLRFVLPHPQPSAVRLYNRTADRQPHAHPVLFRREERLEYLVRKLDAPAAVTDLGLDYIPLSARAYPKTLSSAAESIASMPLRMRLIRTC